MLRAELLARLTALAARMSRVEVRLGALEGRNDEPSRNATAGVTPVTPDRNRVTPGRLTTDAAATPVHRARRKADRRYTDGKTKSTRAFCFRCGTPLLYECEHAPRMVDFPRAVHVTDGP
jgi:hypothetical protein